MSKIKNSIKSIPILGWFIRWSYNLLRLNNIKHNLFVLQNKQQTQHNKILNDISKLSKQYDEKLEQQTKQYDEKLGQQTKQYDEKLEQQTKQYETKLSKLQNTIDTHQKEHDDIKEIMQDLVREQLVKQTLNLNDKLDHYLSKTLSTQHPTPSTQHPTPNPQHPTPNPHTPSQLFLDEYYLEFENKFRGSRESILKRYESYLKFVPFLNSQSSTLNSQLSTLDIGCGRAEWVELLQNKGIESHGLDLNPAMLDVGVQNGIKNLKAIDAFEYLKGCEANSFDLVTAFHIIEHIPFENLVVFLQEIKRVAKDDATILLETPNPQNLQVAACNFYTDPTHLNPLPASVIKFLVEYLGFEDVKINYLNPQPSTPNPQHPTPQTAQDYLLVVKKKVQK